MQTMLESAHDELVSAVGLIGTGNPAAHKVQCAAAGVQDTARLDEVLALVDEAALMLSADSTALPHLSSAALAIVGALGDLAQEQGRASPAGDAGAL